MFSFLDDSHFVGRKIAVTLYIAFFSRYIRYDIIMHQTLKAFDRENTFNR